MSKIERALELMHEYIESMNIDYFAIAEQTANTVNIVLINAKALHAAIAAYAAENDDLPTLCYIGKGEEFARVARRVQATHMWQGLSSVRKVKIPTTYRKKMDIPEHAGMQSRGWEIVVANTIGGEHTGDDVRNVDVIHPAYGRIECKFPGGRIYTAAKLD